MIDVTRKSPMTGKNVTKKLNVTQAQLDLYNSNNRPSIQQCFPQLNASDREFIKTGILDDEWDTLFPDEES